MTLAELYKRLQAQDFGPDDSMIASALMNSRRAAGLAADRFKRGVRTASGLPDEYDNPTPYFGSTPRQQVEAGLGLAGMVQTGAMPMAPVGRGGTLGTILASHGSPHQFERFDMSKIGTGEGAQAYGHGLYFGQGYDSPVAQRYADQVKDMDAISKINDRMKELARVMEKSAIPGKYRKYTNQEGEAASAEYDRLMDERDALRKRPGNLYNVNLEWPDAAREAADPLSEHHLLDWDAPLSEQPQMMKLINEEEAKITKKALEKLMETLATIGESHPDAKNVKRKIELFKEEMESPSESGLKRLTGGEYFNYLRRRNIDPKAQSEMLMQYGIPGIRYLDQGSRGAGSGTRNYVIFDDRIPRIMTRNDVSLADLLRK